MLEFKTTEYNLVKPKSPRKTIVFKYEKGVRQAYDEEPRTVKEHTGKVIGVCVCTVTGKVLSLTKGVHASVCEYYGIDPEEVKKTGWKLDNGNLVWR